MRIVFFVHSLISCWNHGNAHFLRGVVRELQARGHAVEVLEPRGGWSRRNLAAEPGAGPERMFARRFRSWPRPSTSRRRSISTAARRRRPRVVHEWNEPDLVAAIGRHRRARAATACCSTTPTTVP